MNVTIALDAMGGDHGPSVTVPAAIFMLKQHPGMRIHLVGDESAIRKALNDCGGVESDHLLIRHTTQLVAMDESPSQVLRNKKDSSMRVAIDLVKEGVAQACVSAGNTGALMATSRFVLRMLPGIDRPAICAAMPGINHDSYMLDLGANVDSSSEQLFQFALMGSVLVSAVESREKPTIALLNIGEEEMKGNDRVKQAARLLEESDLNYAGYVEGNDIYNGNVDVIVCDGFVGNVALKASEGVAHMFMHFARQEFTRNIFTRFAALCAVPVLKALKKRVDPRRYNGASLLGLRGIVVKSHGSADRLSFAHAIEVAMLEVQKGVPELISEHLETFMTERQSA